MALRLLIVVAILSGCGASTTVPEPVSATPAASPHESDLQKRLDAATADVERLKIQLTKRAKADEIDIVRKQKVAVGRFIRRQQLRDFQAAIGSMSDAEIAAMRPVLVRLRNGDKVSADEYWTIDKALAINGGAINKEWLVNVDWSTNPEIKETIDQLSLVLHSMPETEFAEKLHAANSHDDKCLLIFEREMELMGEGAESEIVTP